MNSIGNRAISACTVDGTIVQPVTPDEKPAVLVGGPNRLIVKATFSGWPSAAWWMWPKPTAPWMPDQVNVPHSEFASPDFVKMFALPDAPASQGRWLAHCCAAVIGT